MISNNPSRRPHRPRGRPSIPKIGRGSPSQLCHLPPSAELLRGIEEFNRGEFFECHETLEALWVEETDPVRYLYQGVLQVGVGCYHLKRGNHKGAIGLLRRGLLLLEPFGPVCRGIDVARFVRDADHCFQRLQELGPERSSEFDKNLFPTIYFLNAS